MSTAVKGSAHRGRITQPSKLSAVCRLDDRGALCAAVVNLLAALLDTLAYIDEGGTVLLAMTADGRVFAAPSSSGGAARLRSQLPAAIVGVYTRGVTAEAVEDDLVAHLGEMRLGVGRV